MWQCPNCERNFKTVNQSHYCTKTEIGELFIGKSDEMVLAFDAVMQAVMNWQPNSVGAAKYSIVFTSHKAWLIMKPMKTELDVKFYKAEPLESDLFKKVSFVFGKYAHHLRIKYPEQVTPELIRLLKEGYDFSMK